MLVDQNINNELSDDDIEVVIDTVTEYMYCNFVDCHMNDNITWIE